MTDTTTIGRLRLRGDGIDDDVVRRSSAAIRILDLQPPALPPAAILCVRTLRDPLPGALDLRSGRGSRATRWEAAVRGALYDHYRRAARPAREHAAVPPSADAVLFIDRAELLASAARDACHAQERWWWKHVLGGAATPAAVAREWRRTPEAIPAAAELLAAHRELAAFVRLLENADVLAMMQAMLAAFAIREEVSAAAIAASAAAAADAATPPAPPRWQAFLPPDVLHEPLEPIRRAFIIAALLLRRAPHFASRPQFVSEVLALTSSPFRSAVAQPPLFDPKISPVPPPPPPSASSPAPPPFPAPPAPCALPPAPYSDIAIPSAFAGVYFLLDLAIALGFYSDFTSPVQHGLDLHLDDFLALAGRRFAGDDFERDPLWSLLTDPERPRPEQLDEDAVVQPLLDALASMLDAEDAPRFLIARPGRVTVTPLHLDVWFSLADHPIEIRLAGLDRDPGWMPAAGRHVAFHFD